MYKKFALGICATLLSFTAAAAPIDTNPITSDYFISYGGLDWAWASPVSSVNWGGGNVLYEPGIQKGWRYATDNEWLSKPAKSLFNSNICASRFWNSRFVHCDYTDSITNKLTGSSPDIWYVRGNEVSAVPLPATAWLLGSALVGLIGSTRRKLAATRS